MAEADLARAVLALAIEDARSRHGLRSLAALSWLSRPGNSELAFWASLADVKPDFVARLVRRRR